MPRLDCELEQGLLSATGPVFFSGTQDSQGNFIDSDKKRRGISTFRQGTRVGRSSRGTGLRAEGWVMPHTSTALCL